MRALARDVEQERESVQFAVDKIVKSAVTPSHEKLLARHANMTTTHTPPRQSAALGGMRIEDKLLSRHDVLTNGGRPTWDTTPARKKWPMGRPANGKRNCKSREADSLAALDELGIAGWLTNGNGIVDDCNATACELVGVEKSQVIGKMLSESVISKHKEKLKKAITGASSGRPTDDFAVSMLTAQGTEPVEVSVSASTTPRRDGDDVTGSLVTTRTPRHMGCETEIPVTLIP